MADELESPKQSESEKCLRANDANQVYREPGLPVPSARVDSLLARESAELFPWGHPAFYPAVPCYRGRFRGPRPTLSATTDCEAVAAWLRARANGSPNTADKYRREAERLLLWASQEKKSLSDLSTEDFEDYRAFLRNPAPTHRWVAPRRFERSSRHWRPFSGPLSEKSAYQAEVVIQGVLSYLHKKGWLSAVAMDEPRRPAEKGHATDDIRALSAVQVDALVHVIRMEKDTILRARAKWLMALMLAVAPRTSDLISATMQDIRREVIEDKERWILRVVGKGGKPAALPLPGAVVATLFEFRSVLGLCEVPQKDEPPYPIIPRRRGLRPGQPETFASVTRNGVWRIFQELFSRAADHLVEAGQETQAQTLRFSTTHDLRHTGLKRQADRANGDLRLIQKLGRHSSIATTAQYGRSSIAELAAFLDSEDYS